MRIWQPQKNYNLPEDITSVSLECILDKDGLSILLEKITLIRSTQDSKSIQEVAQKLLTGFQ